MPKRHGPEAPEAGEGERPEKAQPPRPVPFKQMAGWFLLAASASGYSLSVTNVITFDLAAVPFLWVIPLALFLSTFVLLFKRRMWFPKWVENALDYALIAGFALFTFNALRLTLPVAPAILIHLTLLFIVCMNCHAQLVRTLPQDVRHLTLFYMIMSAGGFSGSFLVTWIIPMLTDALLEYLIALGLAALAIGLTRGEKPSRWWAWLTAAAGAAITFTLFPWVLGQQMGLAPAESGNQQGAGLVFVAMAGVGALAIIALRKRKMLQACALLTAAVAVNWTEVLTFGFADLHRSRNFYGIFRVFDEDGTRYLKHGATNHGRSLLEEGRRGEPISYYHHTSPINAFFNSGLFQPVDIAMIGLGTGVVAAFLDEPQNFDIYEINPANEDIAREFFVFLPEAEARGVDLRVIVGDGRIKLRESGKMYDLIILDAFNSGSIPAHLVTLEAFEEYLAHLREDGIILLQVSNKILHIPPLIAATAEELGLHAFVADNGAALAAGHYPEAEFTIWMALTYSDAHAVEFAQNLGWAEPATDPWVEPWTDQFSNLAILLWRSIGKVN